MKLSLQEKDSIKRELVNSLKGEKEIDKVLIFGSFTSSDNPNDIDIIIFQNSNEPYLPLALKYRKRTREVARKIPLDIIPVVSTATLDSFPFDIRHGEIIYEK